jgi:signal transduction histidine kinase
MRIPFFFMVALFSGFLVQQARKKVEDREKQLDERLKRQERLSMLGQMAAWVAHEIRSPLATIKGRAHLIKVEAGRDGETYQHAQSIDRASTLIEHIVEDILGFSRGNRPKLKSLSLNSLVEDVLSSYGEAGSRQGVELRSSLEADLPKVKVNEEELRRVMLNLLDNSFEAFKGEGEIEVRTGSEKGWVRLQVWDNGPGIPEDSLNSVFDPFYSTKPKGTGLGLSIVHKIVDDHDGTIEVESGDSKGTLFTIRLPVGPG